MTEVKLHDVGEGMTEGEIAHYLVKIGDHVTLDQPVVEVSTDKMVAELPAPISGVIKDILIPVGQTVTVGTTLLLIESGDEEAATLETVTEPSRPVVNARTPLAIQTRRVLATPYTRKIARDHGIDIEQVPASDPSGRVSEEDVLQFVTSRESASPVRPEAVTAPEAVTPSTTPTTLPFRGIRKQIAKKMTQSLFTIPHVTHFEEIDMTRLLALRAELKANGTPVNAFFVKALVVALKDFPVFNAKLDEANDQIILEQEYHIGIAT
ncbi:MAG: dihydrolipoamide acetyltransferase family protein, partial [Exiguobacterium oxidotolerans]